MSDACSRLILKYWRLGAELLFFLVAGGALLAQIGCQTQREAMQGVIHLTDVEYRPAFVVANQSPPATIRYWVSQGHPISVRWGQIAVDPPGCNLCALQGCPERLVPHPPTEVVVSFRPPMGPDVEEARLAYDSGCGLADQASWTATFTPRPAEGGKEEERSYLTSIQFPDASPIPAEPPGSSIAIRIIPRSVTMPPRRLTQSGGRTWEWPAKFEDNPASLYETFDPKLQVGKVRIVRGSCRAPKTEMPLPNLERERLNFECGGDKFLDSDLDETTFVIPYRVIATDVSDSADYQRCESRIDERDGGIDFGPDPGNPRLSLCFEDSSPRPFMRMTPTFLFGVPPPERRRLVWKVEFDADKGFPPPVDGTELWIFFTLEPLP
jgi:hypothetical protein